LYNFSIRPSVPCNCDTTWLLCGVSASRLLRRDLSDAAVGLSVTAELRAGLPPSSVAEAEGNRAREFASPGVSRGKGKKITLN